MPLAKIRKTKGGKSRGLATFIANNTSPSAETNPPIWSGKFTVTTIPIKTSTKNITIASFRERLDAILILGGSRTGNTPDLPGFQHVLIAHGFAAAALFSSTDKLLPQAFINMKIFNEIMSVEDLYPSTASAAYMKSSDAFSPLRVTLRNAPESPVSSSNVFYKSNKSEGVSVCFVIMLEAIQEMIRIHSC